MELPTKTPFGDGAESGLSLVLSLPSFAWEQEKTTMNQHFAEFLYAHLEEADAIPGRIQFAGADFGW